MRRLLSGRFFSIGRSKTIQQNRSSNSDEAARERALSGLLRSSGLHRGRAAGEQSPNSIVVGLFIESLNEVIDLHAKRVTLGLRNRIPGIIWATLYFVAILGMAVLGYHSGLAAPRRSLAILPLIFTFSAVMRLIADLDRPREGYLRVSQQAMIDLRVSWRAPADITFLTFYSLSPNLEFHHAGR